MASQPPSASASGHLYCPQCERAFASGERCPTDDTKLVRLVADVDPMLGKQLDGRYTIIDKLGEGGMGSVYRAAQHSVGREVAIKVINPSVVSNQEAIRRFLRESKLASKLSHPNAVGVLDFGQTDDGMFYLAMELVVGRTLDAVLEAEKRIAPARLVRIGMQICDALDGAHSLSIVHRDLKPANIMLLASGRDLVKVLDFGLAKSVAPDQTSTTMTSAGALLGTPAFMPPELATGQPCDARADLYSLGCVLYLAGSGQLPFESHSIHELVSLHAHAPAPPVQGLPPALAAVIDRLLAKAPGDRYQSAAETRDALEAALAATGLTSSPGRPVAPRPRSAAEVAALGRSETLAQPGPASAPGLGAVSLVQPARSRVPVILGVATVLIAVGIAVTMLAGGGGHARPPAPPPSTTAPLPPPPTPPPPVTLPAATAPVDAAVDAPTPDASPPVDAALPHRSTHTTTIPHSNPSHGSDTNEPF